MAEVLEQEAEVYRALVELSSKKQEALVKGDIEGLAGVVRVEESLLWKAGRVEETRQVVATELADQLGLSGDRRTLANLIEAVGEPGSRRLRDGQERIVAAVSRLNETNQANGRLIEQAMAQVRLTLSLLARSRPGAGAYGPNGEVAIDQNALKVNRQV